MEPLSWRAYTLLGILWFLSQQVLSWGGIESDAPYLWVSTAFFAVFGAACWINGTRCGAIHCRISGPGYLLVALASGLSAIGIVHIGMWTLLGVFLAIAATSFAVEWWIEHRRRGQPA